MTSGCAALLDRVRDVLNVDTAAILCGTRMPVDQHEPGSLHQRKGPYDWALQEWLLRLD